MFEISILFLQNLNVLDCVKAKAEFLNGFTFSFSIIAMFETGFCHVQCQMTCEWGRGCALLTLFMFITTPFMNVGVREMSFVPK